MRDLPDIETLHTMFVCDPESGAVYKRVGSSTGKAGYTYVYISGRQYPAHRLIWKLHTGADPAGAIEHINGDKSDNRIINLRDTGN